jgi:hypothetical protein
VLASGYSNVLAEEGTHDFRWYISAATISATTGVSIDAIREHGLLGGEASMFRKNLGIKW